jgi:hypothetical protein
MYVSDLTDSRWKRIQVAVAGNTLREGSQLASKKKKMADYMCRVLVNKFLSLAARGLFGYKLEWGDSNKLVVVPKPHSLSKKNPTRVSPEPEVP